MALIHATATRNAMADATLGLIDGGTGNPNGQMLLRAGTQATPGTVLATVEFANPAFGAAVAGAASGNSLPIQDLSADASGTATMCQIVDRDGTLIFDGTVGTSGTDVVMVSNVLTAGEPVDITSITYTAPV